MSDLRTLWEPPTPEALERLLPHYVVESLIGRGGMGAVYRGVQVTLERPVAIKLLHAEMAADPKFVARFRSEARTLGQLRHPGIVEIFDFGQTGAGHFYFVMEFVAGADLRALLADSRLEPDRVIELMGQVCDAVHHAHEAKIIHGDLKPANILIARDGRAKVVDFGLARPPGGGDEHSSATRVAMGTPAYMAPEQTEGGGADHRADIYALGVMLYEMLTGTRPEGAFQPPSRHAPIDARLDAVVLKALQQSPERRYPSVSEMKADLDRIRVGPSPAAPRQSTRRRPFMKWAAGAVLAVAAVWAIDPSRRASRETPPDKAQTQAAPRSTPAAALEPAARVSALPSQLSASTAKPWRNSLGMNFVPVPIEGGPTDGRALLFSTWVTQVQDFTTFINSTGREACKVVVSLEIEAGKAVWKQAGKTWKDPGYPQDGRHPVAGVSWEDAVAFCDWLTEREHRIGTLPAEWSYRLPSDHEWSCAAGLAAVEDASALPASKSSKASGRFPWGTQWPPPKNAGNFAGEESKAGMPDSWPVMAGYDDGAARTAPVGSFTANAYGLFDMGGNVAQWCLDWRDRSEKSRVLRGCGWNDAGAGKLNLSARYSLAPTMAWTNMGFRSVIAPASANTAPK